MAINNVRFEPRSQTIDPPQLAWNTASYSVDIAQVLLAATPRFEIPNVDGNAVQLMDLQVQADASNPIPIELWITTTQNGLPNGTFRAELSPGGTFDYTHLTLAMLPIFKSGEDFANAGLNVAKIEVSKAGVISYGATTGILEITVSGAQPFFA